MPAISHHSGKDGASYRGSSKLATTFEVIIGLRPLEGTVGTAGAAFQVEWTKFRREPSEAVRSRIVRLVKDSAGMPQWVVEPTMDDDLRRLREAVMSCQFATQRKIAEELGWDAGKVSRMKVRAFAAGVITERDWKACLEEAVEGTSSGEEHEDF